MLFWRCAEMAFAPADGPLHLALAFGEAGRLLLTAAAMAAGAAYAFSIERRLPVFQAQRVAAGMA
jgi:hypothetical protein